MAELNTKRVAMIVPVFILLGLAAIFLQNGAEGPWHDRCDQLWRHESWHEITALANNLDSIGNPDTEAYFFATLASIQLDNPAETKVLFDRLLLRRFLNREMEKQLAAQIQPSGFLQTVRLRRSTAVFGLMVAVIVFNLLSWKWKSAAYWMGGAASLACVMLLV